MKNKTLALEREYVEEKVELQPNWITTGRLNYNNTN